MLGRPCTDGTSQVERHLLGRPGSAPESTSAVTHSRECDDDPGCGLPGRPGRRRRIVGTMNSARVFGPARYGSVPIGQRASYRSACGPIAATTTWTGGVAPARAAEIGVEARSVSPARSTEPVHNSDPFCQVLAKVADRTVEGYPERGPRPTGGRRARGPRGNRPWLAAWTVWAWLETTMG